jgi:hypothetical protein
LENTFINYRKAAFGFCIAFGVIVGGVLGIVSGELMLGEVFFGAVLGAIVFVVIDWIVARRSTNLQPYDRLDEHHRFDELVKDAHPVARLRGIQDGHMKRYMPFRYAKRR